jgi:hypothetical protein
VNGWEQSLDTHGCSHEPIDQHWQRNQQYPRSVGTDINVTTLMPLLVEAKQLLEAPPSPPPPPEARVHTALHNGAAGTQAATSRSSPQPRPAPKTAAVPSLRHAAGAVFVLAAVRHFGARGRFQE